MVVPALETWPRWIGVALVSAVAAVALLHVMRRCRRGVAAGAPAGPARRWALLDAGMILGTAPALWLTLWPRPGPRVVILVPGRDLAGQLAEGVPNLVVQVIGNLLLFAAFGALAPLRYRIGAGTVLAIAAAGSAGIELAQYVLDIGRFSSVDDVVVNAVGAGLAVLATRRWWPARRGAGRA